MPIFLTSELYAMDDFTSRAEEYKFVHAKVLLW